MGGRGSNAKGIIETNQYRTVGYIEGVPVLEGNKGKHSLPEESHSSNAYIKLKTDGTFHEMRIYDDEHYLLFEIAYHPEESLSHKKNKENILHIHEYGRDDFENRSTRLLTKEEYDKYSKYFVKAKLQKNYNFYKKEK